MTKEQLLALKPGPSVKTNTPYPTPKVSVEAKRVIITNHDLQKREATMDPYYPYDSEEKGLKEIKELVFGDELNKICRNFKEIREIILTFIPDDKYEFLPKYHISLYEECDLEDLQNRINLYIEETLGENPLPGYYEFTYEPFPRTADGKMDTTLVAENDLKLYEENKNVLKKSL